MKWTYQHPPLTVEVEFLDSRTRGSQLYGYLEAVVKSGDVNMLKATDPVSGVTLTDIEAKAVKWAKKLAAQSILTGGDFTPD
ncbi:MAG: hypothetical protein V4607_02185 [Pseudomonadota bacterium]